MILEQIWHTVMFQGRYFDEKLTFSVPRRMGTIGSLKMVRTIGLSLSGWCDKVGTNKIEYADGTIMTEISYVESMVHVGLQLFKKTTLICYH